MLRSRYIDQINVNGTPGEKTKRKRVRQPKIKESSTPQSLNGSNESSAAIAIRDRDANHASINIITDATESDHRDDDLHDAIQEAPAEGAAGNGFDDDNNENDDNDDDGDEEEEEEAEESVAIVEIQQRKQPKGRPRKRRRGGGSDDEVEVDADRSRCETGQIIKIDFKDFMCHRRFSWQFGRRLNFLNGRNGSGG